jgi:hypothetical protein
MQVSEIILSIDQEIARLKKVRTILSDGTSTERAKSNDSKKRARKKRTQHSAQKLASALRKRKESVGRHEGAAKTSKSGTKKLVTDRGWRASQFRSAFGLLNDDRIVHSS